VELAKRWVAVAAMRHGGAARGGHPSRGYLRVCQTAHSPRAKMIVMLTIV
jgi:hypothetical protein